MNNSLLTYIFIFISYATVAQTPSIELGDSLYLNGNFSKAIGIYRQVMDQDRVYNKIAKAYVAIGNYEEALNNYQLSIEAISDDALIRYEYAKLLSKTKKFKEAKIAFNELVYMDYKNPNYHYELGLVLENLQDSTSMNRFLSAYELDEDHQKAIFKIAKHYLVKRLHKTSHKFIDQGLKSYQNNVELISLKAQNFYWQENYRDAIDWFEKLLELGESSEFIHEKLSLSYYHEYEYEKAIIHRKELIKLNPLDGVSWYVVGTYYNRLQDFVKAEEYIAKALEILDKPLAIEYRTLGTVYNQQKKYKEAIDVLKIAVKEDPTDMSTAFFLVRAQDKYYADLQTKLDLYLQYKKKFPKSPFNGFADLRIKELKENKFLGSETATDTITKD